MSRRYRLGSLSDIPPGEGRTFGVRERRIAVFHARDGSVYATQADCPHKNGPLADGLLGGSTLVCPLHEWSFDLRSGQPLHGDCALKVFPVTCERDGSLFVEF